MKGHITKKNNKLVAIVTLPKDPVTGRYPQKQLQALPYETAKELEIRMNLFIDKMKTKDIKDTRHLTLEGYLEQWLKVKEASLQPNTHDNYAMYIRTHINPAIGSIILSKLKAIDIELFYAKECKKYKGTTVLQIHRILRKALSYAYMNKMLIENPTDFVEAPKKGERFVPDIYSADEVLKLKDIVKGTIDELYVVLASGVGLRLSEILGLQWNDIDFDNKTIFIRRAVVKSMTHGIVSKPTKNDSSMRIISIGDNIISLLKEWKTKYPDSDSVINQYNANTYSGHFKLLLKKHHLRHIRFHDLRHFNATYMMDNGVSDKIASSRLGHSTVQITRDIYQHMTRRKDEEAASKLDQLF